MRFRTQAVLGMAFLLASNGVLAPVAKAQETKPVAVVSMSPMKQLLKDTSYLLRSCNVPELGGLVSIMSSQYTQGIDQSKPFGMALTLADGAPAPLIFLPMTDRTQFFGALAGMGIEPDDLGDGLFEINFGPQAVFAKDTGDWMFIAQTENALESVPADPAALLGTMPERYDVAIRLNVQELPEDMRSMVGEQLKAGFDRTMAEQSGQTEEEKEAIRVAGEMQIAQIEQLLDEAEQFIFGWSIDQPGQKTFMDVGIQFVEGSALAEQSDALADLKSKFTGFMLPESSAKFRFTSVLASEQDKEVAKQNLRNSMSQLDSQLENSGDLPPELKTALVEFKDSFQALLEKTIDEGTFDGAGSASVAGGALRVLVGGHIADGNALAAAVQKLVGQLPDTGGAVDINLGYETYEGVTLHSVKAAVPSNAIEAQKVLGETLNLTIGTADKAFMFVLDGAGDASLKAAIDVLNSGSEAAAAPFSSVIELSEILQFAGTVYPNSMLDIAIQKIKASEGNDKIQVDGRVIPRGGVYRLTIDEGILQSVGAVAKAGNAGGGF